MVNSKLLKATIEQKGYRMDFISNNLELSYYAFYNKMHNKTKFRKPEVKMISSLLDLTEIEEQQIFFA